VVFESLLNYGECENGKRKMIVLKTAKGKVELSPEQYSVLSILNYDLILMAIGDSAKTCMAISKEIGVPVTTTYTSLKKLIRAGLVEKDATKHYYLTDKGKEYEKLAEKLKQSGSLELLKHGGIPVAGGEER